MQSLLISGMKEVARVFAGLPEVVKKAKGEVLDDLGRELLEDVQRRIGGSGRVAGVQEHQVGSGKGYVAIRAKSKTSLGKYAAGYVTNALENGHKQTPGRYVPGLGDDGRGRRLKSTRVSGKHMYQQTGANQAARLARNAAGRIEAAIQDAIKGA